MPRVEKEYFPKKGLLGVLDGLCGTHKTYKKGTVKNRRCHLRWVGDAGAAKKLAEWGWPFHRRYKREKSDGGFTVTLRALPDGANMGNVVQHRKGDKVDLTISSRDFLPLPSRDRKIYVYTNRIIMAFPKEALNWKTGRPLSIFTPGWYKEEQSDDRR